MTDKALSPKPLAWISADLSSAITARQVENIPELGGDPSALYPIPLYAGVPDRPEMVKPLAWRFDDFQSVWIAETVLGQYQAWSITGCGYAHSPSGMLLAADKQPSTSDAREAAKTACQTHFNAAILSAIGPAFLKRIEALEAERDLAMQKQTGIGMAIAAGIVMYGWGDTVPAQEILSAAGFHTVKDLEAGGVDEYDINLVRSALRDEPAARTALTQGGHDV